MLDDAKDKRLISETDFERLNAMRDKRNDLRHYDKLDVTMSELYSSIDALFNLVETNYTIIHRRPDDENAEENRQHETSKATLRLPHKYSFLTNTIQKNPKKALKCLVECERALLGHITSKVVTDDNVSEILNQARMGGLMSVDDSSLLVGMNRKYKDLKKYGNTYIDKTDLERWQKMIFDYKP